MSLYANPVRVIMKEMAAKLCPTTETTFSKSDALGWFKANYPRVKQGTISAHLIRFSTNNRNRLHFNLRDDGSDDVLFQLTPGQFRLYRPGNDPPPIHAATGSIEPFSPPASQDGPQESEFAYERDLRNYLGKNLHLIEPGLQLYYDEDVSGIEFPAGGRFIDILAVDAEGGFVVIELKVSRGYDRVVGQLLRYMSWIEKYQAEPTQRVRGVIVAKEVSDDLRLACTKIPSVLLFEYSLSVSLRSMPACEPEEGA